MDGVKGPPVLFQILSYIVKKYKKAEIKKWNTVIDLFIDFLDWLIINR